MKRDDLNLNPNIGANNLASSGLGADKTTAEKLPHWVQNTFETLSTAKISQAIIQAELKTSGEIVPMIVRNSSIVNAFWYRLFPPSWKARLVLIRAELEFYRLKLNVTQGKTGILLFVSCEEHQAVVLADENISGKLPPETWDHVIEILLKGLKDKNATQGFCDAILKCGEILSTVLPAKHLNPNELPNRFVIRD